MFSLIRRISYGVIPRPDRPWEEDATSNAPAVRKKRRLSSTERDARDETEELARGKKARSGSQSPETEIQEERETPLPQPEAETKEVKEVTKGVKEVAIEDTSDKPESEVDGQPVSQDEPAVAPESVPLPDDGNSELDDLADASGEEDDMASDDEKEGEAVTDVDSSASESKDESDAPTAVASEAIADPKAEKQDTENLAEPKSDDVVTKPAEAKPASSTVE